MRKLLRLTTVVLVACFLASPLPLCLAADNPMISQQDKIIAECTDAIAANPRDFVAYFSRASAYYNKKLYDETLADCGKAIEINPNYAAAYSLRGYVYQQRKIYDQAIEDFSQAVKIDAAFAQAYTNRAWCYNQKEQYDLAITDSNRAIELAPKMPGFFAYYTKGYAHFKKHQYNEALEAFRTLIANSTDPAITEQAKGYIRSMGGTI
ncbi:MAG: tetratricopeptide repeat protein [Negativicutes bacterium]|nr:tetratricopeptide repeat protein [Negativicutes bacterium]